MSKNNLLAFILIINSVVFSQEKRARDYGIDFGVFKTGIYNSITDVEGVKVGHVTLSYGKNVRTGVTAIIPHPDDLFRIKTPTAIFIGNGFGKLYEKTSSRQAHTSSDLYALPRDWTLLL